MFTSHAHVAAASGSASARVSSGGSSVDAATVADWSRIIAATLARGIIATLLGLAFWAAAPAVVGWQPTTVMTGSMMPRVAVGDVVISRPVDSARLDAGQVLLFDDPDHEGALRLHRVDSTAPDGTLITKGDANAAADSSPVPRDDVHGIGVLRVPLIGMPIVWLHDGDAAHLVLAGLAVAVLIAVTLLDGPLRRRPEPDPSAVAGRAHGRHGGGGPAGGGSGGAGRAGARAAGSGRGGIHRAGVAVGRMLRVVAPAAHVQEARDGRSRTAPPRIPGRAGVGTRRLVLAERRAARRRRRLLWGSGLSALVIATAGIGFVLPATAIAAPFLATTVNPKSSWTAGMVGQPAAVPNTTTLGCVNAGSNGVTITFAYPAGADADSFELQGPGLLGGTVTYGSTAASSATSNPNSTKSVTFTPTAGLSLNLASTVKVKAVLGATGTLWTSTSDATTGVTVSLSNGLRCR